MKIKIFTLIFIVVTVLEIIFGSYESLIYLHYFTKPAIVITLLCMFLVNSKHYKGYEKNVTILALVFSLLGDVLLMFVSNSENFFIAGLVSFLLAHIMYVLVFLRAKNPEKKGYLFTGILLVYAIILFYFLKDNLGDLMIPVIVYMAVILTMAVTAFLRKKAISEVGYLFVFIGALFFLASDSLLAINKFHIALPLSNLLIMLTYAVAQYCIVLGIIKSNHK